MISPFKRFFGGIVIGIFLSMPIILSRGNVFGSQLSEKLPVLPMWSSEALAGLCLVLLGFACAWLGVMATRASQPSSASLSTLETLRRRRQRRQGLYVARPTHRLK